VAAALRGETISGIRASSELQTRLLYVAVPVASGGQVFGAVRITYPTSTLDHRVNRFRLVLAGVAGIVIVAAALIGWLLARSVALPIRRVEAVAARIGGGDLTARADERDGPPEVRRLAAELNRSTAKLATLVADQEQFVADASHELRTPLTALRLRLETADTAGALAEAGRLARIVDELLALARFDASGAAEVDLAEVAAERVHQWEPLAAEHEVRLVAAGPGGRVIAGEGRVRQVLDNLLANAIEVAPAGSAVTIRADGKELHVVDAGPGLSEDERVRAFDRFWTKGKRGGSGLGLAIARRLVELDGGTIELRPAEGGGTDAAVTY
jgi:signal transduction histidine kinase